MFSRFDTIPACDGQTDGQTFGDSIDRAINSDVGGNNPVTCGQENVDDSKDCGRIEKNLTTIDDPHFTSPRKCNDRYLIRYSSIAALHVILLTT